METYPCPACGGPASEATGCRDCGRPHDPDAAALALFQRTVASLEQKKRDLTDDTQKLRRQLAHASAQRDSLRRKVRQTIDQEQAGRGRRPRLGRGARVGGAKIESTPPVARQVQGPTVPPGQQVYSPRAPQVEGEAQAETSARPPIGATRTAPARNRIAALPQMRRPPGGGGPHGPVDEPEATTSSMQASVLALGGLLLAGAAIVLTTDAFGTIGTAGRVLLLALITAGALALPLMLVRRGLTATAETVASVALLLVLLDGYVLRSEGLLGADKVEGSLYTGLVCAATAGIAAAYSMRSHLIASRYATLIALQPVLPLLAYDSIRGPAGWSLALSGVALIDLAFGVALGRSVERRIRQIEAGRDDSHGTGTALDGVEQHEPHTVQTDRFADALMRDAAWVLFVATFGAALLCAAAALATTEGLGETVRAAAVTLVAAAIGVTGSLSWRRGVLPDIAAGIATVAVIAAFARVGAVAFPGSTLLFLALAVALAAAGVPFLPGDARRGPRYAVSVAAAATTALLVVTVLPVLAAPLRAAWPVWKADLTAHRAEVDAAVGADGWQYVLAVLLLTAAGVLMLSGRTEPVDVPLGSAAWPAGRIGTMFRRRVDVRPQPAPPPGLWPGPLGGAESGPRTGVWDDPRPGSPAVPRAAAAPAPTRGRDVAFVTVPPPERFRPDVAVVGAALTLLIAPAAFGLSWLAIPALTVAGAIVAGALAMRVREAHTAWVCLSAALVLGLYAAAAGLARPASTALILLAISVAGAGIALLPRPHRIDAEGEYVTRRVADAGAGGALFALPGAAAAGAAILFGDLPGGATVVLVMSFLALAVTLGYAAITQVARGAQSPPLLIGATAGAVAVAIAVLRADGATTIDLVIGLLMVIAVAMLWLAPRMDDRQTFGADFTGADAAAAAVTIAGIGAVARAVSLASDGIEVVTLALLVFAVAVAARTLPDEWRRGPVAGATTVGVCTGLFAGSLAVIGAVGVIRAADPPWRAVLDDRWLANAQQLATYGWQVPIALLLLAGAAAIALPQPYGDDTASSAAALAAIGAPVGLGLGWQSPMVIGWIAATGIAAWAATAKSWRAVYTRLGAALVAGMFAAGASLVRPGATAGTLVALAVSGVAVAGFAKVTAIRRGNPSDGPLTFVGGCGVAGALFAFAGAAAAAAGGLHPGQASTVLIAALATSAVGLAAAASGAQQAPGYLPYVTVGVAGGATTTAVAALIVQRDGAVVYAAAAALLGVLAELLRVTWQPGVTWVPMAGFRPDNTSTPGRWRQVRAPRGYTVGVAAAAGLPALIVVVFLAPAAYAALAGPYKWIQRPWTGTAQTAADLGELGRFAGNGTHVLAAALLTIAGALMAVGLGGSGQAVAGRAVAIVVPCAALTMLIAPAALHAPWPWQPTAALLVATIAGLGLALTVPPDADSSDGRMLILARRLVFVIAVLAAGAGGAGSLATKQQTLTWLAGSIVVGAVAGIWGRTPNGRMLGWHVAASTAQGFALAAGLAAGLPLRQCAFPLLIVATMLLVLGAALPRLRPGNSINREAMTIEAAGYAGAVVAVLLTLGSAAHTAAALTALGAVLGLSAARKGRSGQQRVVLIIAASVAELIAIWLLLITVKVALIEAYTLPFAVLALITGLLEIRRRPELGSWLAYGPALVAGFAPSLALAIANENSPELRRVLLILAGVITVAIGAVRQQKAPVAVGSAVTIIATVNELLRIGLPVWMLLLLFGGTGLLLITLGATYEQRQRLDRLRGVYRGMR
ncbi:SCO7613 C-terminal domain-containing membrane protein [Dactylosporangium sp. NPDC000521]|uniref:SCO7613 C-terminal domain-containing membrane protein n=1 Tax=Dactylosporangium sp. NPDC000521 TaxID=3363975 RepID=UPI0036A740A6